MGMNYRRWTVLAVVMVGSIVMMIGYTQGNMVPALIFLAVQATMLGLLLWFTRPKADGVQLSHAAAQAAARDGDVILYWQPG